MRSDRPRIGERAVDDKGRAFQVVAIDEGVTEWPPRERLTEANDLFIKIGTVMNVPVGNVFGNLRWITFERVA